MVQNEKLTAEQYFDRNFVKFKGEYFISRNDFVNYSEQVEHATAELLKELDLKDSEILSRELDKKEYSDKFNIALNVNEGLQFKIESLKTQLTEAQRHRNEARNKHVELSRLINSIKPWMAEEFHRHDYKSMWDIWQFLLSRLSSGETK